MKPYYILRYVKVYRCVKSSLRKKNSYFIRRYELIFTHFSLLYKSTIQ